MNLHDVYSYIEEASDEALVVYIGIGCGLGGYPPHEHPPQQYPPYLRDFPRRQICVLIDPTLEMPPLIHEDIQTIPRDITVLTVQENLSYSSWFLSDLARLCTSKHNFMIVHDFAGANLHEFYPLHLGREALKYILYDPTYSNEGSCGCDFTKIRIFRDADGCFRQPYLSPFAEFADEKEILQQMMQQRKYPIVHLLARLYRILRGVETPRDWCTTYRVAPSLTYFRYIYQIPESVSCLRQTLVAIVRDLCTLSGTDTDVEALVDGSGPDMETFWNATTSKLRVDSS